MYYNAHANPFVRYMIPLGCFVLGMGMLIVALSPEQLVVGDYCDVPSLAERESQEFFVAEEASPIGLTDGQLAFLAIRAGRPLSVAKDGFERPKRPITKREAQHIPSATIRPARAHTQWLKVHKDGMFKWPVNPNQFWVSSFFGPRTLHGQKGFHHGLDLAAPTGTWVTAAAAGKVIKAHYAQGYGNHIIIRHGEIYQTLYAHLHVINVRPGQWVRVGQPIGKVGATGKVTKNRTSKSASHLHFEVRCDGKSVDPFAYLA